MCVYGVVYEPSWVSTPATRLRRVIAMVFEVVKSTRVE